MDTTEKAKGAKPLIYRLTVMWKQCWFCSKIT